MYFDRHFSLVTGYRFLLRDILSFISSINLESKSEQSLIVDIGCGKQPYKHLLNNWKYIGIDNDCESDAYSDLVGSIDDLPFNDEELDAVLTVWVLDDVFDLDSAFSEISRVLRPGGKYFAVESQATHIHNPPYDFFRFSPFAISALGAKYGLKVKRRSSFGGDFALIGFALITTQRVLWGRLGIDWFMRPFYCLIINSIFGPLDFLFRRAVFKGAFEINSLGYCYTLVKEK